MEELTMFINKTPNSEIFISAIKSSSIANNEGYSVGILMKM